MNRHPGLAKELIKICLKPRPLAEQSLDGLQLGELAVAVEGGFPSRTIKAIGDERHAVLRTRRPCRRDRVGALALAGRHQRHMRHAGLDLVEPRPERFPVGPDGRTREDNDRALRSEEHTSEHPSLMRITYAVFRLQQKKTTTHT